MDVLIRPYVMDDAAAMGQLLTALDYAPADAATMQRRLARLAQGLPHAVFVADWQGKVVGWVHIAQVCQTASDGYAEVYVLTVDPTCQGKGVGRKLLAQVEHWVVAQLGGGRIRLGSGVHRTEAHKFYEHLDYSKRPSFVFEKHSAATVI